jgi:ubiquinone/menaquinone biosynthesis C-methylase UbiE
MQPSGLFGKIITILMNYAHKAQFDILTKNINIQDDDTILEIGFGDGLLLSKLIRNNTNAKYYGIDISEDMIKTAKYNNKKALENKTLSLSVSNIEHTDFADKTFIKIYTINTVYFWQHPKAAFNEIKRLLKPGGSFYNIFYSKDYLNTKPFAGDYFHKYTVEEVTTMTRESGLRVVSVMEIEKGKGCCVVGGER